MNLKLKAALIVTGMLSAAIGAIIAIRLVLANISVELIPHLFVGAALAIAIFTLYDITLTNLKYNQKLKDMVDQKTK